MIPLRAPTLLVLAALAVSNARVAAQARPDASRDSAAAVRAARDAQRTFELERVRLLPPSGSGAGGACDERLGRMCLTHDEGADWWPVPERPGIVAAREVLLRTLEGAAARAPGDGWIVGQRVLYLGEAGRWDAADSLVRASCAPGPDPWCLELEGLALHELGRFPEAERAFRAALARMEPDSVRAWLDPTVLLDPAGRAWLKRFTGRERERAVDLVWALADPLFLVPGNDQLTEQWSRRTVARARADARNTYGMSWADDLGELLLRYGLEAGWERGLTGALDPARPVEVTGHHDPESRPSMPPGAVLAAPAAASADTWVPDFARPRSAYAPAYAAAILPADARLSVLPRGDRFVLLGAYSLPDDTTFHARHRHPGRDEPRAPWAGGAPEAGLFLSRVGDGLTIPLAARVRDKTSGALLLEAPAGRWVASLEVLDLSVRRAGRLRVGIDVPVRRADEQTLSALILMDGPIAEGASLEELAAHALPRDWVRVGERVGLAWELFGFSGGRETVSYELTLERARPGVLRRAVGRLGLLRPPAARRLEWEEPAPDGPSLRSVELDLAELEPGPWVVRLEIHRLSGATLIAEQALEIRSLSQR